MGRRGPTPKLKDLVHAGTYRPHRHGHLLAEDDLPWADAARLQERYRLAAGPEERRAVARAFGKWVAALHEEAKRLNQVQAGGGLHEQLGRFGKPGSFARVAGLFPGYFRHLEGRRAGQPFELEAFQQRILRTFLECDRRGRRKYVWLLLGMPRGNGKTPLAAGLGYDGLFGRDDHPQVFTVSGSREQARICLDFANGWRDQSLELGEWTQATSQSISCPLTGGRWRVLSSDGRLGHGRNPTRGICDEWWALDSARETQAVTAILSALHKRDGDFIGITTAGYDLTSQLGSQYAEMLHAPTVNVTNHGCLTIAENPPARKLMFWYGAPDNLALDKDAILAGEHDPILRACNPLSTLTIETLRGEFALIPSFDEARRLILNQWTQAKDAWLPAGLWATLGSDAQIPDGADIYVAVDAALKYDTTACSWAARLEDGRIHLQTRVWSARPDAPHHVYVPGGRIDNELVETYITDTLARRYHIREVVYDPRYFDSQGARLANTGLIVAEYPQGSSAMADAWQHFYEAASSGDICHNRDPILAQHVQAAAAILTERGWKIYKLKSSQPIDALVAATMARERASRKTEHAQVEYVFDLRRYCTCSHSENRHTNGYFECRAPACTCVIFNPKDD